MSRKRFEQLPPERQDQILEVAARAFAQHGFAGTSYNALLAELGLGKGSAYYYFADKEDLFLTVVQSCYRRFFDGIGELPTPATVDAYWATVAETAARGMRFMRQDPVTAAVVHCFLREQRALDVLASAALQETVNGYYSRMLELGQTLGTVRRDVPAALLLNMSRAASMAFDQWFVAHATETTAHQIRKLAQQFAEMMRGLLAPR